jgi:hypothetical protein
MHSLYKCDRVTKDKYDVKLLNKLLKEIFNAVDFSAKSLLWYCVLAKDFAVVDPGFKYL